jgi:hypothetical protein
MEFRNIKGIAGDKYWASACGKIKREEGVVQFGNQKRKIGGTILSPAIDQNGYEGVGLSFEQKDSYIRVHRLVAMAWIGNIPKGMCINHIDGNKRNNNLSNLEIVTYSENSKHAYRMGLNKPISMKGEEHPLSRLTSSDVIEIRRLHKETRQVNGIAKAFNISVSQVQRIVKRQSWSHI